METMTPKGIRAEIKRLKSRIREIDDTIDDSDHWREMLGADWDAAWASPAGLHRDAAAHEIEALWGQVDHLNDTLHGRELRLNPDCAALRSAHRRNVPR
jgi:hypothetical protein